MTPKQLLILLAAAVLLGGAYLLRTTLANRSGVPAEVGKPLLAKADFNNAARIEITTGANRLEIVLDNGVWRVPSLAGYPADFNRIRDRLRGLADVKISDVLRGMSLDPATTLSVTDAAGKELAVLHLGQARQKNSAQGMMWQPPEGRYLRVGNNEKIFLVKEDLSDFSADARAWVDTRILSVPANDVAAIEIMNATPEDSASFVRKEGRLNMEKLGDDETFDTGKASGLENTLSWLSFADVLPANAPDAITGLSTGTVFRVMRTNGENIVASIGNSTPDGNRYAKFSVIPSPDVDNLDDPNRDPDSNVPSPLQIALAVLNANLEPYIFTIPAHTAANMTRPRAEFVKPVEKSVVVSEPVFIEGEDGEAVEETEEVEAVETIAPPDPVVPLDPLDNPDPAE